MVVMFFNIKVFFKLIHDFEGNYFEGRGHSGKCTQNSTQEYIRQ